MTLADLTIFCGEREPNSGASSPLVVVNYSTYYSETCSNLGVKRGMIGNQTFEV